MKKYLLLNLTLLLDRTTLIRNRLSERVRTNPRHLPLLLIYLYLIKIGMLAQLGVYFVKGSTFLDCLEVPGLL
jgi:hypothetical protein